MGVRFVSEFIPTQAKTGLEWATSVEWAHARCSCSRGQYGEFKRLLLQVVSLEFSDTA
jgi:hypothetical protein